MPGEQGGYLEQKADEDYDGEGEGEEGEDAYDEGEAGEEVKSLCVRHLGSWGYKDLGWLSFKIQKLMCETPWFLGL